MADTTPIDPEIIHEIVKDLGQCKPGNAYVRDKETGKWREATRADIMKEYVCIPNEVKRACMKCRCVVAWLETEFPENPSCTACGGPVVIIEESERLIQAEYEASRAK